FERTVVETKQDGINADAKIHIDACPLFGSAVLKADSHKSVSVTLLCYQNGGSAQDARAPGQVRKRKPKTVGVTWVLLDDALLIAHFEEADEAHDAADRNFTQFSLAAQVGGQLGFVGNA